MREWFASLAACAVLSEIADALSPPVWKEHIRRIAALCALIVLVLPLRNMWRDRADLPGAEGLFSVPGAEEGDLASVGREAWSGAAALVFETAENLGLEPGRVTVRFSEDGGELTAVRVSAPGSPYVLRAELEETLSEAFGVPVTVEGTERAGEEGGSG
ncbi:MAG: hypothetical protein E7576_17325 [Ruminococcaceae bacterium]|nr:hypothetical protein [Oscillospiraceae bacterium]